MAIVNKNFRVKNGLIVDGSVATVNGYNVLTEASTAFIISTIGGSADSANTPNSVVKRDGNGNFAAGTITATFLGNVTGDVTGTVSSISNHDTNDLVEGTGAGSNLYFTNARALAATAAAYDPAGSATTAQANAATDATSKVAAEATARNSAIASAIATEVADRNTAIATAKAAAEAVASADATSKANAAEAAAIAAAAIDATTKSAAALASANTYADGKVSALVDSAPALLDTLNELAAAIGDDANFATTLTTSVGTKVSKAGDTMSGNLAMGNNNITGVGTPSAVDHAANKGYVDTENTNQSTTLTAAIATAKSEAISTASADATTKSNTAQTSAETAATNALNAVKDGTTKFTAVNVNDVAVVKAATTTVSSASTVNALTWAAADYRTAKALVKFKNGANTQVSEILLTLDTSNNVAITEFGSIGTNGDLGSISAAYVSGNVSISVTTVYASTDVMVYATLIK
jgi:hypothetical protein